MSVAVVEVVGLKDIDYNLRSAIQNKVFIHLQKGFGTNDVDNEHFKILLDSGLRNQIELMIKDYYAFLGCVDVEMDDTYLYSICVQK